MQSRLELKLNLHTFIPENVIFPNLQVVRMTSSDLETWRQSRLASASSLRQLAQYVDNVGQFSSILLHFREAVFTQAGEIFCTFIMNRKKSFQDENMET